MSTSLQNTFSWSFSRDRTFAECRRKYYWRHYGSWGGWERAAPPAVRLAYRLKNLSSLPLWKGELVHAALGKILIVVEGEQSNLKRPIALKPIVDAVLEPLHSQVAEALMASHTAAAGPSRDSGKFFLLQEDRDNPDRHTSADELVLDVKGQVRAWATINRLRGLGSRSYRVLSVEALESVEIAGVKVFFKLDLLTRQENVGLVIWDWKTGKAGSAPDERQLALYALFLRNRRRSEAMHAYDVYLKERPPLIQEAALPTGQAVTGLRMYVKRSIEGMAACLKRKDLETNEPEPMDKFPQVRKDGQGPCRWCAYKELCYPETRKSE